MNLIEQIITHRKAQGVTQEGLAAKCGLRQPHIARMERSGIATLKTIIKVAEALEVELRIVEKVPVNRRMPAGGTENGFAFKEPANEVQFCSHRAVRGFCKKGCK
jgi:transcriptional regulator with XRE-family HTH domain